MKKVIISESQLKRLVEGEVGVNEEVYHGTFSSAVQYARHQVEKRGIEVSEEDWWSEVNMGPGRPKEGETTRITLGLKKDGKELKKALHIQVYNMGNKMKRPYELNYYIN